MTLNYRQHTLDHCQPQMEVPFSIAEYRDRLDRVRARMAADGIDLLWVLAPQGQCWLSGYQAEWYMAQSPLKWPPCSGIAVHVDHDCFIHFDTVGEVVMSRYATVSTDTRIFPASDPIKRRDGIAFIIDELKASGWLKPGTRVGQELWSYRPNPAVSQRFREAFEGAGGTVSDASLILRELRGRKSPAEIACIERAGAIADVGIRAVREALYAGATELEIYGHMVAAMAAAGGENPGITMPVLSGPKSNCGHALASRKAILPGENVNIDLCGVFNRYHANMARSYWMGTPPDHIAAYYEKIAGIFDAIRPVLRTGMPVAELNKVSQEYFREHDLWDNGAWLGGYEMGIAFPPDWVGHYYLEYADLETSDVFEAGTAVNFEAVFYMPDMAGITHLIDTIVFKEDAAVLLSQEPYGLSTIAL